MIEDGKKKREKIVQTLSTTTEEKSSLGPTKSQDERKELSKSYNNFGESPKN